MSGIKSYHNPFGGRPWRVAPDGIHTREHDGPHRTPGPPRTMRRYLQHWGAELYGAAQRYSVPVSLLLMIIATENGAARSGPVSGLHVAEPRVRHESDSRYSVGPCHVLMSSARRVLDAPGLQRSGLLNLAINIQAAAAYVRSKQNETGWDPILVSAAYNAGGVYEAPPASRYGNPWRIRTYGNHLDRAAAWYGDACAVLADCDVGAELDRLGLGRVVSDTARQQAA